MTPANRSYGPTISQLVAPNQSPSMFLNRCCTVVNFVDCVFFSFWDLIIDIPLQNKCFTKSVTLAEQKWKDLGSNLMTGTLPWFRSKGRDPGNEIALESYVCDIAPDDQSQGVKIRIPQRKLQDLD